MLLDFNEKEKRAKMELSILLIAQIAKLFIMIFMGYAIVKMGFLKDEDSKVNIGALFDCTMCDSECISGRLYAGKSKWTGAGLHCIVIASFYITSNRQPDWKGSSSE